MADTIINKFGKMQGWNSITFNILGRDVEGITSFSYTDAEEKENVYGAGKYPIGRGSGNYSAEVSATFYKEEYDAIQAVLPPGKRIQDIEPFDIIVMYEDQNGAIKKDIVRNVEFTGRGVEATQNDKTFAYEAELVCSHIDWNVVI